MTIKNIQLYLHFNKVIIDIKLLQLCKYIKNKKGHSLKMTMVFFYIFLKNIKIYFLS